MYFGAKRRCINTLPFFSFPFRLKFLNSVFLFYTSPPPAGIQSIAMSMSVCLSARISQKQLVQTSRHFQCMLVAAVARSSSNDNAIRNVGLLPVLWKLGLRHKLRPALHHLTS